MTTPKSSPVKSTSIVTTPKSSPVKSISSVTTSKSPVKLTNIVVTPKTSPIKSININTTPKSSSKNVKTLNLSPAKTTLLSSPQKSKQLLISPKKCTPEKSSFENKTESSEKKLDFSDDDKTTIKAGFKRKVSPIKTPENKKFKLNSLQSPDTQVSDNIIYPYFN